MATTIRDVARAASVSIGTVSRALKNQPGLSEATRVRVVEVAQRLGYDSGQLRTRIRRVTFLLHRQHNNFAVSPFFSHVLNGFDEACRGRLVPSVLTAGPTQDLAQQMRLHAPDAIAVAGFVEPELLAHLHSLARPTVLIDLHAPGFRSVNIDNVKGASLASSICSRSAGDASRSSADRSRITASRSVRSAIARRISTPACSSIPHSKS